ncbi:DUF2334 domain-containing protein [Desulfosporosinus sp. FKA]|uniref:DUF2334 domain-containing protein n=1 Tax=Desulfosporosinus sp. FKA TaxID=1969834 RepID=UPI000B4A52BA|nr:DUF2334 domain-containing protein [Desulfosporosinus sp. FKA]
MNRQILIRFDDICPTMNWIQWGRAEDIFTQFNVRPLIGVIPDCSDPDLKIDPPREDFWDYIKLLQSCGYAIAMHGFQHVFDINVQGIVNSGTRSEFAGHSYEIQYEKIKKGKEILLKHGIETDIFFAPAHSYDWNTIKALSDNGFKYMSDGKSMKPVVYGKITCLPCRSSGVPKIGAKGYYTTVFHAHEWVRAEKAAGYEQLIHICSQYQRDIVDFENYRMQIIGERHIQIVVERLYVFWQRKILPILVKIKHKTRGIQNANS